MRNILIAILVLVVFLAGCGEVYHGSATIYDAAGNVVTRAEGQSTHPAEMKIIVGEHVFELNTKQTQGWLDRLFQFLTLGAFVK